MCTAGGSIAAADFASDHRGAQGVFGAPVGGVNRVGVEEEGEDRRKFDGEMRREVPRDAAPAWSVDEGIELILQMPARDGDAIRLERLRDVVGGLGDPRRPVAPAREPVVGEEAHVRHQPIGVEEGREPGDPVETTYVNNAENRRRGRVGNTYISYYTGMPPAGILGPLDWAPRFAIARDGTPGHFVKRDLRRRFTLRVLADLIKRHLMRRL